MPEDPNSLNKPKSALDYFSETLMKASEGLPFASIYPPVSGVSGAYPSSILASSGAYPSSHIINVNSATSWLPESTSVTNYLKEIESLRLKVSTQSKELTALQGKNNDAAKLMADQKKLSADLELLDKKYRLAFLLHRVFPVAQEKLLNSENF